LLDFRMVKFSSFTWRVETMNKKQIIKKLEENFALVLRTNDAGQRADQIRILRQWDKMTALEAKAEAESVFGWK